MMMMRLNTARTLVNSSGEQWNLNGCIRSLASLSGSKNAPIKSGATTTSTSSISFKYPAHFLTKHLGRKRISSLINDDHQQPQGRSLSSTTPINDCPDRVDVAIFGGGIIGQSVAYFLKANAPTGLNVAVFEKDLSYKSGATTSSLGGIRQQWQQPENILMALFSAAFLQNAGQLLQVPNCTPPDVAFRQNGYLLLADESQVEQMIENHKLQLELGASVELYNIERIQAALPHINTEGILLGSRGTRNEGWFDSYALLQAMRAKIQSLGGHFVNGEVVDFNIRQAGSSNGEPIEKCNSAVVRDPTSGRLKEVEFGIGVIAAGVDSIPMARKLGYGIKHGVRATEFPVEKRKRFAYLVECAQGPRGNLPFLLDTTGAYFRPEGPPGHYIFGKTPAADEEPDSRNLEIDYSYLEHTVHPLLAHRVPAFATVNVKRAWAGYYDYNRVDHNPIIGQDPYYSNLIWAAGFTGRGLQMGPAVGRALMELVLHDEFKTIDLSQYSWDRFFENRALIQDIII